MEALALSIQNMANAFQTLDLSNLPAINIPQQLQHLQQIIVNRIYCILFRSELIC